MNLKRIDRDWDDMLRIAGSLSMGKVRASELMRSLLNTNRPSSLAKSLAELGRIPKTLHMLRLIDDEAYRRGILNQLNRGEGRHDLAREVFHGRRGELRQRYREGQEDQLGALGLVVNVLILWKCRRRWISCARKVMKSDSTTWRGFGLPDHHVMRGQRK